MKDRSLVLLACLFAGLSFLSCRNLKDPDFKGMENLRIGQLGVNESNLTLDLHYFNPNRSRLKLRKAEGDAWMDNNFLGHFIVDTLVLIPAKGDFRLPVKLRVDLPHLLQNSLTAFLKKEVVIRIEGMAKIGKGVIFINYPLHYEEKEDTRQLLKY